MAAPKTMDWEVNERKEKLFAQIISVGVKAFLTNRANVPPSKDGKGGQKFDRKHVWTVYSCAISSLDKRHGDGGLSSVRSARWRCLPIAHDNRQTVRECEQVPGSRFGP